MAQINFNAQGIDPQQANEAKPAGWYSVVISNSVMKETSDKSGQYLELALKIIDGTYVNQLMFDRLNLVNNSQMAVEIAYRRLAAYCQAVKVFQIQDTQQLHNIPFKVRVGIENDESGKYEPSNRVKEVHPIEKATPASPTGPSKPVTPPVTMAPPAMSPPAFSPPTFTPPAMPSTQTVATASYPSYPPATNGNPVLTPAPTAAAAPVAPVPPWAAPTTQVAPAAPGADMVPPWAK